VSSIRRKQRSLATRAGTILFPAYIPVTTFGKKYPLDDLIRPFLPRLSQAAMVSLYYAKQSKERLGVPMMVDSGGFASLFKWATVEERDGLGVITLSELEESELITPESVLSFQEDIADIAFTLDFPIPPTRALEDGELRVKLTVANAIWAIKNRRRRDMPLYACIQGWDVPSYVACAEKLSDYPFEGVAIGGLVPRARDHDLVMEVVEKVRSVFPDKPLHVFGLGQPEMVKKLFELGVDSIDSSSYVKMAADGRSWGQTATDKVLDCSPLRRMHLALGNLATASQRALPLGLGQITFGYSDK
jgi:queuine/archaeosine tRNA-ribosyltransferase